MLFEKEEEASMLKMMVHHMLEDYEFGILSIDG